MCKNILDLGNGHLYNSSREFLDNYPSPLNPPALNCPQMTWEIKSTTEEDKSDVGVAKKHPGQVRLKRSLEKWGQPLIHHQCWASGWQSIPLPYLPCLCQSVLLYLWLSLKTKQNKKIHSNPALVLSLNWGGRSSMCSLNEGMGEEGTGTSFPRNDQKHLCSEQVQLRLYHVGFLITARWQGKVYLLPSRVWTRACPTHTSGGAGKETPKRLESWKIKAVTHTQPLTHIYRPTYLRNVTVYQARNPFSIRVLEREWEIK